MLHDSLSLTARDLAQLQPFRPAPFPVVEAVSFDRCVAWLADARCATGDAAVHQLIDQVADELELLGRDAVHADPALADAIVGSLASVEAALVAAVS